LVQELQQRAQQYQNEALDKARRQLAIGTDPQQVLETLARGLSNKFLHHPMRAIQSTQADAAAIADAIELLFPVTDNVTGNNDKEVNE
jgi:glutamyl-tRNA reductase